jgi:hypothetical protein
LHILFLGLAQLGDSPNHVAKGKKKKCHKIKHLKNNYKIIQNNTKQCKIIQNIQLSSIGIAAAGLWLRLGQIDNHFV